MFEKCLNAVKNFFKTRGIGFYFTVAAWVLALVQLIVYAVAFATPALRSYGDWETTLFSVIALVLCVGLACFKPTERFAPVVLAIFELLSFYMFIYYGYMYFSTLFYSGITWDAISLMHYGYWLSIVLYVLIFASSIVAIYTKQSKEDVTLTGKEVTAR